MPEVIINGPDGRLECRYMPSDMPDAPTALILHPEPDKGGTMNNRVTYALYKHFQAAVSLFCVLISEVLGAKVNMIMEKAGVGRGNRNGLVAGTNPASRECWIAGFSFGSWIGMQLMMRRPEIQGFIAATPPALTRDFSFLAPCPASGLIVHGEEDEQVPPDTIYKLVERLSIQKGVIDIDLISGANHFFTDHLDPMIGQYQPILIRFSGPNFDPLA